MSPEASGGGKPIPPLVIIACAAAVLVGIAIVAWGAGKQYRELADTLQEATFTIQQQQRDIVALRTDVAKVRADLADIRGIAAKAGQRVIEYKTVEVPNAHAAVDSLPVSELEPVLRAVADEFIASHAPGSPGPAGDGDPPDR